MLGHDPKPATVSPWLASWQDLESCKSTPCTSLESGCGSLSSWMAAPLAAVLLSKSFKRAPCASLESGCGSPSFMDGSQRGCHSAVEKPKSGVLCFLIVQCFLSLLMRGVPSPVALFGREVQWPWTEGKTGKMLGFRGCVGNQLPRNPLPVL